MSDMSILYRCGLRRWPFAGCLMRCDTHWYRDVIHHLISFLFPFPGYAGLDFISMLEFYRAGPVSNAVSKNRNKKEKIERKEINTKHAQKRKKKKCITAAVIHNPGICQRWLAVGCSKISQSHTHKRVLFSFFFLYHIPSPHIPSHARIYFSP